MRNLLDSVNECISIIKEKGTLENVLAHLMLRKIFRQLLGEYENTV